MLVSTVEVLMILELIVLKVLYLNVEITFPADNVYRLKLAMPTLGLIRILYLALSVVD